MGPLGVGGTTGPPIKKWPRIRFCVVQNTFWGQGESHESIARVCVCVCVPTYLCTRLRLLCMCACVSMHSSPSTVCVGVGVRGCACVPMCSSPSSVYVCVCVCVCSHVVRGTRLCFFLFLENVKIAKNCYFRQMGKNLPHVAGRPKISFFFGLKKGVQTIFWCVCFAFGFLETVVVPQEGTLK